MTSFYKFQYCQKAYELQTAHSGLLSRQSIFMLSQIYLLWTKSPPSLGRLSRHIPLPVFFTSINAHCRNTVPLQGAVWTNCFLLISDAFHCFQEQIEPFHCFTQSGHTAFMQLGFENVQLHYFRIQSLPTEIRELLRTFHILGLSPEFPSSARCT